jgi:hypothetical protein
MTALHDYFVAVATKTLINPSLLYVTIDVRT